MLKYIVDGKSILVQVVAWCHQATNPLPKQMLTQICIAIWRHHPRPLIRSSSSYLRKLTYSYLCSNTEDSTLLVVNRVHRENVTNRCWNGFTNLLPLTATEVVVLTTSVAGNDEIFVKDETPNTISMPAWLPFVVVPWSAQSPELCSSHPAKHPLTTIFHSPRDLRWPSTSPRAPWDSHWNGVVPRLHWQLTHLGRVTHICVSKLIIIDSDNGLSPGRFQAIIWNNSGILLRRPFGNKLQWNLNQNLYIFIQENALENVI